MGGVITRSKPSWIGPFTGLSPRQFGKLVTVLRHEGADAVRKGRTPRWESAMVQREYAAEPLVDALGTHAAELPHGSIRRALECVSLDGTAPPAVDGVHVA